MRDVLGYIDAHTHTYFRGPEDLKAMVDAGIEGVVVCSFFPAKPSGQSTFIDLFEWLVTAESQRLRGYRIKPYVAVGVHPATVSNVAYHDVLRRMDELIKEGLAYAVGEVGLEEASAVEEEVFKTMISLASEHSKPLIVHTPKANKEAVVKRILNILSELRTEPSKVVVDHLTPKLVGLVKSYGAICGLTLQEGKLAVEELPEILRVYGPEQIVLNTDMSRFPSDVLAIPKAAHLLSQSGFSKHDVELVSSKNIKDLLCE